MTVNKERAEKEKIKEVLINSYELLEEKLEKVNENIYKVEMELQGGINTEKKERI